VGGLTFKNPLCEIMVLDTRLAVLDTPYSVLGTRACVLDTLHGVYNTTWTVVAPASPAAPVVVAGVKKTLACVLDTVACVLVTLHCLLDNLHRAVKTPAAVLNNSLQGFVVKISSAASHY